MCESLKVLVLLSGLTLIQPAAGDKRKDAAIEEQEGNGVLRQTDQRALI